MITNSVIDMTTKLRNACKGHVHLPFVFIQDTRITRDISKILLKNRFIKDWFTLSSHSENKPFKYQLVLELAYTSNGDSVINHITHVSKPGFRFFVKIQDIKRFMGYGKLLILSTDKGIITGKEALKFHIGGEILLYII
uniref:ribosomal protein S8 n=1 Tax=Prototheca tumulicola TaxID=1737639 RepID=UPI003000FE5E